MASKLHVVYARRNNGWYRSMMARSVSALEDRVTLFAVLAHHLEEGADPVDVSFYIKLRYPTPAAMPASARLPVLMRRECACSNAADVCPPFARASYSLGSTTGAS